MEMRTIFKGATTAILLLATAISSSAMISVGDLSKDQAKAMGIVMKSRKNGDAGVQVWLEFKREGILKHFTYAELQVEDEKGKHLISAMLRVNPVIHGQPAELVSVAFSAEPEQLKNCSFRVVAYGSSAGDVGYDLKVSEFLELEESD